MFIAPIPNERIIKIANILTLAAMFPSWSGLYSLIFNNLACFIEIYINIYFDNRPTVICFRDNLRNPPRNIEYCARKISLHKWIYTTIIIMLLNMVNIYRVRWDSDPRHFNPSIDWLRARRSTWLSYEPLFISHFQENKFFFIH
jgi:hypothetical protein